MEKSPVPVLGLFPYQKSLSGFLFHDHRQISGYRWFTSNAPYRARPQLNTIKFCDLF